MVPVSLRLRDGKLITLNASVDTAAEGSSVVSKYNLPTARADVGSFKIAGQVYSSKLNIGSEFQSQGVFHVLELPYAEIILLHLNKFLLVAEKLKVFANDCPIASKVLLSWIPIGRSSTSAS
eukprot:763878-Hanusia_phi.AAC.3